MYKPPVWRAVIILPGNLVKNFIENITYSPATVTNQKTLTLKISPK